MKALLRFVIVWIIIVIFLILVLPVVTRAQNINLDKPPVTGQIKPIKPISSVRSINLDVKKINSLEDMAKNSVLTEAKATYKAKEYPIYMTSTNKYFIVLKSTNTGNYYRRYVTKYFTNPISYPVSGL